MSDLLARLLLALLRPLGFALDRWRFLSLGRQHRRLVARLLGRRRYSRLLELYGMAAPSQFSIYTPHNLAVAITNVGLVFTWDSVAGWPIIGNFKVRIDDPAPATTFEIVEMTSVNVGANTTTATARGGTPGEGTTAIAHPIGAVGGNVPTPGMIPWGKLGRAVQTATIVGIVGAADLTGAAIPVTVGTGREIRISFEANALSSVLDDTVSISIMEGATLIETCYFNLGPAGLTQTCKGDAVIDPTPGAHTYKLTAARAAGTGGITVTVGAGSVTYILVEDIGPA